MEIRPKPFEGISATDIALMAGFVVLTVALGQALGIWLAQKIT